MTTAQRITARQRLEDARDSVLGARDGGPDDGGVCMTGSVLYETLSAIIRELDSAIDGLRSDMADDYGARLQAVTATRGFVGGGSCIHAVEHTLDDGPRTFCGRIPSWVSDERLENFPGCMTCVRVIFSRTDLIAPPSN